MKSMKDMKRDSREDTEIAERKGKGPPGELEGPPKSQN